jgi:hypothetical protein
MAMFENMYTGLLDNIVDESKFFFNLAKYDSNKVVNLVIVHNKLN